MKILFFAIIGGIWLVGLWHLWRRQTASSNVDVGLSDRLLALFWLPLFILFLILSMPDYLQRNAHRR